MNKPHDPTGSDDAGPTLELVPDPDAAPVLEFRSFFAECHPRIARALAVTLGDDDLAADATAEAMTRAYERWPEVMAMANPAGWVYRVGLNWAHSRRRKLLREVFRSPWSRADLPDPASSEAPVDPDLAAALASLPVDQRAVVVLRHLLDWSEFQTAEALQIAPGTVKSRLSRALDRLAVAMEATR